MNDDDVVVVVVVVVTAAAGIAVQLSIQSQLEWSYNSHRSWTEKR